MKFNRSRNSIFFLIILIILFLVVPLIARADTPGYAINWWTVDNGGMMNHSGGSYILSGTIGQPDAGTLNSTGYTLNGGFWSGTRQAEQQFFLPMINR